MLLCSELLIKPVMAEFEVAFTPSQDCELRIIDLIKNSTTSIDVDIYSLSNQAIVEALIRAKERHVQVRILTDKLQASGKYSKAQYLYDQGINIRVNTKNKLEHNKFAIFDGRSLVTGSYNWTNAASNKNSENCMFLIKEPEKIQAYQNRFEELWQLNTQEKSDEWFEKRKQKH